MHGSHGLTGMNESLLERRSGVAALGLKAVKRQKRTTTIVAFILRALHHVLEGKQAREVKCSIISIVVRNTCNHHNL